MLASKLVTDSTCRARNGAYKDYAAVATMLSRNMAWFYVWYSIIMRVVKVILSKLSIVYTYMGARPSPALRLGRHAWCLHSEIL